MQPHLAAERIELERADAQPCECRAPLGTPQQGRDPGLQLRIAEGFRHIVITPPVKAAQAIELAVPAREHEHRELGVEAAQAAIAGANLAHEVEPVAVGQAEVDDHEVRVAGRQQQAGVVGAIGPDRLVAVGAEVVGQEHPGGLVILDDKDRCTEVVHARQRVSGP